MKSEKLNFVYFSPTGTTESVLHYLGTYMNVEVVEQNVTEYSCRDITLNYKPDDIVVFGFPVYGGLVPQTFIERLKNIKGDHTYAVLLATYGNRDYQDALLEMKDIAVKNGFQPIGAAAVVTEHSVIRSIASGRPDTSDLAFLEDFAKKLKNKIDTLAPGETVPDLRVPGKRPHVKPTKLPMAPSASKACTACGLCAKKCPVGAISLQNLRGTDRGKCIGCMRCVRVCPQKARHVSKVKLRIGKLILCALFKADRIRREPEMFF